MENIVLTGATGFLGKYVTEALSPDFTLLTVGRNKNNTFSCEIQNELPIIPQNIDYLVHIAGKAHSYPKTEQEKKEFFEVNVKGTQHILQAIEEKSVKKIVFISSVSVYGLESGENISETASLKGNSPYAKSKIQAEELIENYAKKKGIPYLILRLPLIIGKNPPGNLGKMIQGIKSGKYARIAKGEAKKSVVIASDVASLIRNWLIEENTPSGIYNLTDGVHPTFYQLEEKIKKQYNKKIPTLPYSMAKFLGKIGDRVSFFPINSSTLKKITCTFTFSDEKAKNELGWKPHSSLDFDF